jgi:hypothetical protein
MHAKRPKRIVSGGQTGVDRGALDAAIARGVPHGGWCPRGRRAEDGTIPAIYRLMETDSPKYAVRTRRNVVDSDATLILHRGPFGGGTELTRRLAERHGRPCLLVDLESPPTLATVRRWLAKHQVEVLNVAGPRESQCPGIAAEATEYLKRLLA